MVSRRALVCCSTALIVSLTALIVSTYSRISLTADEPAHFSSGMQLLQTGRYDYETQHPPLARIMSASVPYLLGIRLPLEKGMWEEGYEFIGTSKNVAEGLTQIRLGILPFFILLLGVSAVWAFEGAGGAAAILAIILVGANPIILGHFGIATTDGPVSAMLVLTLFCVKRWLDEPSRIRTLNLIFSAALTIGTKFSALLFLPAGVVGILLGALVIGRGNAPKCSAWLILAVLLVLLGPIIVWSLYGFEVSRLRDFAQGGLFENYFHDETFSPALERVLETPLPLAKFVRGLAAVYLHNRYGHLNYFMGDIGATGWWSFFPVLLFYKSPLAMSGLILAGFAALALPGKPRSPALLPLFAALLILGVAMCGSINIGLRHALVTAPLLSLFAAISLGRIFGRSRMLVPGLVSLLVLFQLTAVVRGYPDFIGYFNESAPADRSAIVTDSDLDWGQYNFVLRRKLRKLRVKSFTEALFCFAKPEERLLPPAERLEDHPDATGWIVLSKACIRLKRSYCSRFATMTPVSEVGNSLLIFRVPSANG